MSNASDTSVQQFDFEEWAESVEGETILVDAPDGFPDIPSCYYIPSWSKPHREFWCSECDRMRFPVYDDHETAIRHCPVCGNPPWSAGTWN